MKIALVVSILALGVAGSACKPKSLHNNKRVGDPSAAISADALAAAGPQGPGSMPPGSATGLTVSGPASLTPGTCSSAITITSVDNSNVLAPISATESPLAAAGGPNLQFYSDAACTKKINGLTFPGRASSLTIYAIDVQTENLSVVFTIGDLVAPSLTLAVQ